MNPSVKPKPLESMKTSYDEQRRQGVLKNLWIAFALAILVSLWKFMTDRQSFVEGYFYGFLFVVGIPIGALGIWIIHTLTGGAWGLVIKKYYVAMAWSLPIAFVLGLPNLFWLHRIYGWMNVSPEMLASKSLYLNQPFFLLRTVLYFAIWLGSLYWLSGPQRFNLAGLLGVLYVFSGTFASIDWVMSIDYHWYSTMFGILSVEGRVLLGYCFLIVLFIFFENPQPRPEEAFVFRDLGNLLLVMVMLWAYMSFAQFLIIWMGNLPEEINWYLPRIKGGWGFVACSLIVGHFFIPFLLLLRRAFKKDPQTLIGIALWVIVMRCMDIAWTVFPALGRTLSQMSLGHVAAALSVVSLYFIILMNGKTWRHEPN